MQRLFFYYSCAVLLCYSSTVLAQNQPQPPQVLMPEQHRFIERFIDAKLQPLRGVALDGKELTAKDIERLALQEAAQRKAQKMSLFYVHDLDGDGRLNADEAMKIPSYSTPYKEPVSMADTNKDGFVSADEFFVFVQQGQRSAWNTTTYLEEIFALDPNNDGVLTAQELEELLRKSFRYYDQNNDGVLSKEEQARVQLDVKRVRLEQNYVEKIFRCVFPKAAPSDKVYFISAYEAGTLSNVSVAGQAKPTETATINIQEGAEPLYIAVSSYTPIIWKLTGHTERVRQFFAAARGGVGVIGLDKSKVTLNGSQSCTDFYNPKENFPQKSLDIVANSTGHSIDETLIAYTLPYFSVPFNAENARAFGHTGKTFLQQNFTLEGLPQALSGSEYLRTLHTFKHFNPGGVAKINPATVIASGAVEPYRVLPEQAGLLQLIQEGVLKERPKGGYNVLKPLSAFPAGLAGAHAVTFFMPKGMKRPASGAGHSSVIYE